MKIRRMDRRAHMAQRPWSDRERRIVWRGLTGRFAIAVEPLLGMLFFAGLTWGIIWRSHHSITDRGIWILAPLFGFVAVAFLGYLIAVLVAPFYAYMQTFKPIYIVDGYVRYRGPDVHSEIDATGYVAVLFEDRGVCCEWEAFGKKPLPELTLSALVEFSTYGGIHKIDGKSTGVLPEQELPLLAIGIAPRH